MKLPILALAAVASILHAAPKNATPTPPSFYTQTADASGITIRASDKVEKATIEAVRARIDRVLAKTPGILTNLKAAKTEVHIYARTEVITDLPEYKAFAGRSGPDGGTWEHRFHGGKATGMLVACGEENVMRDTTNPYPKDYDVCTHELTHVVLDIGLDAAARQQVIARYRQAMNENLYDGTYAATTFSEFFAETSTRYFGYSGGALEDSDRTTYGMLDSFYSGNYAPPATSVKELVPLSGEPLASAHSPAAGYYTSGVFVTNKSSADVRESFLDEHGQIISSTSQVLVAGSEDALPAFPATAVIFTDDKTKGTIAVLSIQNDLGRFTVDDKMVHAQKAPTPEQIARTSGPTRL